MVTCQTQVQRTCQNRSWLISSCQMFLKSISCSDDLFKWVANSLLPGSEPNYRWLTSGWKMFSVHDATNRLLQISSWHLMSKIFVKWFSHASSTFARSLVESGDRTKRIWQKCWKFPSFLKPFAMKYKRFVASTLWPRNRNGLHEEWTAEVAINIQSTFVANRCCVSSSVHRFQKAAVKNHR